MRYTFDQSLSGTLTSGRLYIMEKSPQGNIDFTDKMIGMPILEDMTLEPRNEPIKIRSMLDQTDLELDT